MTTASSETLPARTGDRSEPDAIPAKKKKGARPYVILGTIVAVALSGYGLYTAATRGHEGTDDAQVDADVVPISSRVSGPVLHVLVGDNEPVKKDQPIVEIDPADYKIRLKQAEAELSAATAQAAAADAQVLIVAATSKGGLSAAKAMVSGSATSVSSAGAQIAAAQAALARAQAEDTRAQTDLQRAESLRKDDAIPQAQLDTARANAASSTAAVAQAQAQLAAAQESKSAAQTRVTEAQGRLEQSTPVDAQLDVAKANADLAHARADAAKEAVDLAKQQLSYTTIVASADGVLSKLAVREGQLVQPGSQVVSIVPSTTYVVANFKETQVGQMQKGQRADIEVDAYPGRKFEGVVESTSPGTGARFSLMPPDNASGNFVKVVQRLPVKIAWSNLPPDVHMAAGLSADVTVHTR